MNIYLIVLLFIILLIFFYKKKIIIFRGTRQKNIDVKNSLINQNISYADGYLQNDKYFWDKNELFIKNNNPKKIFITFGGGGHNFRDAGDRLINQINKLKLFDEKILYTDTYLENDKYFWDKHKLFIKKNKRGYGYWLWKPYIIKITMDKMKDGDILFYLDAGCEVYENKASCINNAIQNVHKYNILAASTNFKEKTWNKMDLLIRMNMNNEEIYNLGQTEAGILVIYVNEITRKLVKEWFDIASENNYHYIDDTPSIIPNHPEYKEHRHDQSIFSLLSKKYNIQRTNIITPCIEVLRNKTGVSKLK
jgi:hypothetical protein